MPVLTVRRGVKTLQWERKGGRSREEEGIGRQFANIQDIRKAALQPPGILRGACSAQLGLGREVRARKPLTCLAGGVGLW